MNPEVVRRSKEDISVLHLHGDCYAGHTLHTAEQLRRDRPQLWQWLLDYLQDKYLLVVGYSGWDDIVTDVLSRRLGPAGRLNVMWAVHETSHEMLAFAHPHLTRFLADNDPQAVAYLGIDRDRLFADLADALRDRGALARLLRRREPQTDFGGTVECLTEEFGFGRASLDLECVPKVLFWPHRLREPHLIHGVHSITAALLQKQGLEVKLYLDDIGIEQGQAQAWSEEFQRATEGWFEFVGATAPQIERYSSQVATDNDEVVVMQAGLWALIERLDHVPSTYASYWQRPRSSIHGRSTHAQG